MNKLTRILATELTPRRVKPIRGNNHLFGRWEALQSFHVTRKQAIHKGNIYTITGFSTRTDKVMFIDDTLTISNSLPRDDFVLLFKKVS